MRTSFVWLIILLAAALVTAQTDRPKFEVASVKPAAAGAPSSARLAARSTASLRPASPVPTPAPPTPGAVPTTFRMTGATLKALIISAYHVGDYQISGPGWMGSERYDVSAKAPEGAPQSQVPLMLQSLLAERFKLALHRETKDMSVYGLVVAKGGPKLTETTSPAPAGWPPSMPPGMLVTGRGAGGRVSLMGQMTLEGLVQSILPHLGRPVVDFTGLKGTYYIKLDWTGAAAPVAEAEATPSPLDPGDSIFAVLETNLGLRLEKRNAPVEVLIIDHAEKTPTEN